MPSKPKTLPRTPHKPRSRAKTAERGYGYAWTVYSVQFRKLHPLCADCEARGLFVPAAHVDHIKPHRGNALLFWDPANLQALCGPCHSRKTAREGGFGRVPPPPAGHPLGS